MTELYGVNHVFTPSSKLRLLKNVKTNNTYSDCYYFDTIEAQTNFFYNKTFKYFDTEIINEENTLTVELNIYDLYSDDNICNYIMFQNSNFGNKWFYAFVTDLTYVGINCTKLTFELDFIQTFLFDIDIANLFVEREHVDNDIIGLHIMDEGINIGELKITESNYTSEMDDLAIIVATTTNTESDLQTGEVIGGYYSGVTFYKWDFTDYYYLNNWLKAVNSAGKTAGIVSIFMMPKNLLYATPKAGDYRISYVIGSAEPLTFSPNFNVSTMDGYTPKNNKLKCFPYNFIEVSNNSDAVGIYKFEYFNGSPSFKLASNVAPSPTVFLTPKNYNGLAENFENTITQKCFPICSWNSSIYGAWLAQNLVTNIASLGGSLLSLGVGLFTNPLAAAAGAIGVANTLGQFYEKSIEPPKFHGSIGDGSLVSVGKANFVAYHKSIRYEYAKRIDDYFTMFGYKVATLKTPNLHSRRYWNYIKITDGNIGGNIPNIYLSKIKQVFINGVTFWHDDDVGDYSKTNSII